MPAQKKRGLSVFNTPGGNAAAATQYALDNARRIPRPFTQSPGATVADGIGLAGRAAQATPRPLRQTPGANFADYGSLVASSLPRPLTQSPGATVAGAIRGGLAANSRYPATPSGMLGLAADSANALPKPFTQTPGATIGNAVGAAATAASRLPGTMTGTPGGAISSSINAMSPPRPLPPVSSVVGQPNPASTGNVLMGGLDARTPDPVRPQQPSGAGLPMAPPPPVNPSPIMHEDVQFRQGPNGERIAGSTDGNGNWVAGPTGVNIEQGPYLRGQASAVPSLENAGTRPVPPPQPAPGIFTPPPQPAPQAPQQISNLTDQQKDAIRQGYRFNQLGPLMEAAADARQDRYARNDAYAAAGPAAPETTPDLYGQAVKAGVLFSDAEAANFQRNTGYMPGTTTGGRYGQGGNYAPGIGNYDADVNRDALRAATGAVHSGAVGDQSRRLQGNSGGIGLAAQSDSELRARRMAENPAGSFDGGLAVRNPHTGQTRFQFEAPRDFGIQMGDQMKNRGQYAVGPRGELRPISSAAPEIAAMVAAAREFNKGQASPAERKQAVTDRNAARIAGRGNAYQLAQNRKESRQLDRGVSTFEQRIATGNPGAYQGRRASEANSAAAKSMADIRDKTERERIAAIERASNERSKAIGLAQDNKLRADGIDPATGQPIKVKKELPEAVADAETAYGDAKTQVAKDAALADIPKEEQDRIIREKRNDDLGFFERPRTPSVVPGRGGISIGEAARGILGSIFGKPKTQRYQPKSGKRLVEEQRKKNAAKAK